MGANYKDYNDFKHNFDQYGNSGIYSNPDIDLKDSKQQINNFLPYYKNHKKINII